MQKILVDCVWQPVTAVVCTADVVDAATDAGVVDVVDITDTAEVVDVLSVGTAAVKVVMGDS